MKTKLANHFFLSDKIIEGVYNEKKEGKIEKHALSVYLLMIGDRHPERELFINGEFVNELIEMHNQRPFRPAFLETVVGVIVQGVNNISSEESLVKKASIIAAKKSPETLNLLVSKEEKEVLTTISEEKKYNIKIICAEDLLRISGVDYPLRKNFMGQLAKFSSINNNS